MSIIYKALRSDRMIKVESFSIPIEKSFHPLGALKINVQDDAFDNGTMLSNSS